MKNKKLIAIDGNSLINRAYYALPPLMTKDGLYTNAVYGFINMLNKVIDQYDPAYMIVAFDRKAPTFRHLEYEKYKAGRKQTPQELLQQFPLIKEVLEKMHIKMLEMDGFEADDLIGTAVKRAEEEGLTPMVITGDKDELQLVSDVTTVMITKKGISEFDLYDTQAMEQRYQMTPQQFVDLKGLMGDSSDNIPGIPGVGEKTGINLILQFGSIEQMLAHTDQIKGEKLRQKVEENAQLALMSKRLSQIQTNVPIDLDFNQCKRTEPDLEGLTALYQKMELFSLLTKLKKPETALPEAVTDTEGDREEEEEIISVTIGKDQQIPEDLSQALQACPSVYIKVLGDCSHVRKSEIYGISVLIDKQYYYFQGREHASGLVSLFASAGTSFKGHFLKDDYFMMKQLGMKECKTAFDSAIAQYVIEPQRSEYSLSALAAVYLNQEIQNEKDFMKSNVQLDLFSECDHAYAEYGLHWCRIVKGLESPLKKRLEEEGSGQVYYEIELPLIEIFADMEYEGFQVDRQALIRAGAEMTERIAQITRNIYELAGESFNINSPRQLGTILFEKLGLPGGKKTKTGYSTSADILEKIKDESEIIPLILEYRMLTKLNGTYIEGLLPLIDPEDGKIRAHFQQTGTATGRISCTEPNLQNIPVRHEEGRLLRKAFIAEKEDCVLVDADYSQIELRVLAHLSRDRSLLEAFRNGEDIHRSTAAKVFDVSEEQVTPLQRSSAKAVNFGVIYGMSGFGLSENLNITRKEAERYIREYFKKYTGVKAYMDAAVAFCKEHGYVTTIFHRKRNIPEIKASNYMTRQFGERLAMNSPIQGSAADIIKIAMIRVYRALREKGYRSRLILQVHDELIINTYAEELEAVKTLVRENMMGAADLEVPLEIGMDSGNSWYEAK